MASAQAHEPASARQPKDRWWVGGRRPWVVCVSAEYIEPMFRTLMARAWATVPAQCAVCRGWPARPLCNACVSRHAQPLARCATCALPWAGPGPSCGACRINPPPLDACVAAVRYGFPWSACIADFKFNGQPGWGRAFATLLRSTPWVEPALDNCDRLVPMPLSAARLRDRGFNQALVLARALASGKAEADLLVRLRDTAPQHALGRTERLHNVRGAFAVQPLRAASLRGQRVVLVDDVMTSGASLHAAATVLREAGAAHITALVVARTDDTIAP